MADKKFSGLVANPDTNLAVAAVGDYLLIYDISEPLDINKIKVISIADFQDSIKVPNITTRQGGSAVDWNVPGSTNYTITIPSLIKIGSYHFSMTNTRGQGQAITFNTQFSVKPIILTGAELVSGDTSLYKNSCAEDITENGFTLWLQLTGNAPASPPVVIDVFWLAIALS